MSDGQWKFYLDHQLWDARPRLFVIFERPNGNRDFLVNMTFKTVGPDETMGDFEHPFSHMGRTAGSDFLRSALNAAWEAGLRPDGFDDTRESMKATNAHLQDMRALVFAKAGTTKP